MPLNGVLVVDKPSGPTSHDVVARVRRATGETRIGHTGTLDPLATGVLALVIGRATRLARFLSGDDKEYRASVRLGRSTPTYDAEGVSDARTGLEAADTASGESRRLRAADLDAALAAFRGTFLQMPPPYSAKKVAGTRAYEHARKQQPVELRAVEVTVRTLDLLSATEERLELRVVCSSGFYVRTLAHDLGRQLGCGAYLEMLRRTRAGDFTVDEAVTLDAVQAEPALALAHLVPMERLLPAFPRLTVNDAGVRRVTHGNTVGPEHLAGARPTAGFPARVRLFDEAGGLLAIGEPLPGGVLHPAIVLV
jgi:tRNA pseudouridine55 synthase